MCQRYLGLTRTLPGCETISPELCDAFMDHIREVGNFGVKGGLSFKTTSFVVETSWRGKGAVLKRLQAGGLSRWKAAKKFPLLKPFAWLYQLIRILLILRRNKVFRKELQEQQEKGIARRELFKELGWNEDRTIRQAGRRPG